jgi:hypothetical protein
MKSSALWALLLVVTCSVAYSEDSKSPPATEPTAAAAETKPAEAKPAEAKPAEAKPAEAKPAPAAKCECPACPADASKDPSLLGCAKALETVTAGLKDAYYGFRQWTGEASKQLEALEKQDAELQGKLVNADTQIAKLKAESEKKNKKLLKELAKDSKQFNKDLAALRKEKTALCAEISRTAAQKVKEIQADLKARLDQAQNEIRQ